MAARDITTEEREQAIRELGRAIQKYQDTINEGEYVTAWVVLTEKNSIELQQSNKRAVGVCTPSDQTFVTTRGLLDIVVENERAAIRRG